MFDALTSVAGITLLSNRRRELSFGGTSMQEVGAESLESTYWH
jgi:hypothetical protein